MIAFDSLAVSRSAPAMTVISTLQDYAEGLTSHVEWLQWWNSHAEAVEAELGRFTFLRIKRRGHGGVVAVLEGMGLCIKPAKGFCGSCGEPMFQATPGVTTVDQIRAFAASSQVSGRDEILACGWIHPGEYCPKGCTAVLHTVRRRTVAGYFPERHGRS